MTKKRSVYFLQYQMEQKNLQGFYKFLLVTLIYYVEDDC